MIMRHNLERDGQRYWQKMESELSKLAEIQQLAPQPERMQKIQAPTLSQGEQLNPDSLKDFLREANEAPVVKREQGNSRPRFKRKDPGHDFGYD
jgi:hypothetical protein